MGTSYFSDLPPDQTVAQDAPAPVEAAPADSDGAEMDTAFLAEPRRPLNKGAILLFAIAIFGCIGTYAMVRRNGPSKASAETTRAAADAEINHFLTDGPRTIHRLLALLDSTRKIVEQFNHFTEIPQVPLKELHGNPFKFSNSSPVSPDAIAEAERQKHAAERQSAIDAVQKLELQSIICSHNARQCMINNTLYPEGAQFDAFTLEKVTPDYVIVRTGAYRFQLKMRK